MSRFVALVDQSEHAFGVVFPQLPGCVSMGETLDDAVSAATDALAEWIADAEAGGRRLEPEGLAETVMRPEVRQALDEGAVAILVPLLSETGRSVRANLSLDAGLLQAIDEAAKERGLTRSSWLASAARKALVEGA